MKTYRGLYDELGSFENLYRAYRAARRGKRGNPSVADFELDQEGELLRLRDELAARTWKPGPYHNFYVHEPKRRLISAAPFRDRVVHHALVNVLEPIWEPRFIHDSYANRRGKGTHRALARCGEFARRCRKQHGRISVRGIGARGRIERGSAPSGRSAIRPNVGAEPFPVGDAAIAASPGRRQLGRRARGSSPRPARQLPGPSLARRSSPRRPCLAACASAQRAWATSR